MPDSDFDLVPARQREQIPTVRATGRLPGGLPVHKPEGRAAEGDNIARPDSNS
jgi:hypothetical protein